MAFIFLYLGLAALLVYVVWGLTLLFMQPRLTYRPGREVAFTPAERGFSHEDAVFRSRDGVRLTGWYVPAPDARLTVLFCHGNGGNIMHAINAVDAFHGLGLNCLVFDYRGYGNSEGRPTEVGTYLDARAAFDWLTQVKGVPAERIILCGRSLGGAIAAHLATEVRPAALALEGTFTSYADIAAHFYPYLPVRLFVRYRYNTLASVKRARCPLLVVHSKDDRVVPLRFGVRLHDAAPQPKQFTEIVGSHNDGFTLSADRYRAAWAQWIGTLTDHRSQAHTRKVARPCEAAPESV